MFTSSFYVLLVAAFGAVGLTGNAATAYVIQTPEGPTFELIQHTNSSELDQDVAYNVFNPLTLDRNNLTTCPCSVTTYQVPNQSYLTNVLQCIIDALILFPNDIQSFCEKFALLYLQIYILPNNKCWNVCAGCNYCYNPGCDIWVYINLNVFGGISIKIYN